jgi:hypothetical protein
VWALSIIRNLILDVNDVNRNVLNLITVKKITPHPIPLPSGGEGRVRGTLPEKINCVCISIRMV